MSVLAERQEPSDETFRDHLRPTFIFSPLYLRRKGDRANSRPGNISHLEPSIWSLEQRRRMTIYAIHIGYLSIEIPGRTTSLGELAGYNRVVRGF